MPEPGKVKKACRAGLIFCPVLDMINNLVGVGKLTGQRDEPEETRSLTPSREWSLRETGQS
jgi:hypothetical protein